VETRSAVSVSNFVNLFQVRSKNHRISAAPASIESTTSTIPRAAKITKTKYTAKAWQRFSNLFEKALTYCVKYLMLIGRIRSWHSATRSGCPMMARLTVMPWFEISTACRSLIGPLQGE
jgi:hypothetical protein